MTQKEERAASQCSLNQNTRDDCRCADRGGHCVNTHFTLALVAIIFSCFSGFFSIALSLGALILSLRAQDLARENLTEEAKRTAFWSALFSWLTIAIALLPIIAVLFFGGAIVAALSAVLAAA